MGRGREGDGGGKVRAGRGEEGREGEETEGEERGKGEVCGVECLGSRQHVHCSICMQL